ncbi:glycosyltransferase family 2 protein [Bifidobacterium olomucense]|uniref:Family 2 glucosyltransferase n=1 Tax=Bifidobacterium olomucense TaxID=2675324 RepID=A0A7Y0HX90_9BIFI|nr:glycosyltransferase family 2 protein [Bifidobacterium sp. DSM 109959]NMM99121.1 family 2 glucosyltransferase [Bifidobacterium sp. DSM 109959]
MATISVVMASYNGEKYIQAQIDSILNQLDKKDELIISDDGSTDNTVSIIRQYALQDTRVIYVKGPCKGVIANFDYGFGFASNDIIVPSDQDDIWKPDKIKVIRNIFDADNSITCMLHDVEVVDQDLQVINPSFFSLRKSKTGFINNLIKNSYMGSAMAFRRSMLRYISPIPGDVPMHDQWIGLINELYGQVTLCQKTLGLYRRHNNNISSFTHGNISHMIDSRYRLSIDLLKRYIKK